MSYVIKQPTLQKEPRKVKCPICKTSPKWHYSGVCTECKKKAYDLSNGFPNGELVIKDKKIADKIKAYEDKLESKRKYKRGEPISTLDELLQQTFVYWQTKIMHIEAIKSWQFRFVLEMLNGKRFYKAIKKDKIDE